MVATKNAVLQGFIKSCTPNWIFQETLLIQLGRKGSVLEGGGGGGGVYGVMGFQQLYLVVHMTP